MRVIPPSEHRSMPWKNGGGTTREILVEPGADDRYRYRVSIADVASDGPFSRFDGYDRHIVLLEGAGMTLDAGGHGRIALERFVPHAFSGDWDVTGTLKAGPVRDFNLIVDRSYANATLEVVTVNQATTIEAPICIVHALDEEALTIVGTNELQFVPAESARIIIARIFPV